MNTQHGAMTCLTKVHQHCDIICDIICLSPHTSSQQVTLPGAVLLLLEVGAAGVWFSLLTLILVPFMDTAGFHPPLHLLPNDRAAQYPVPPVPSSSLPSESHTAQKRNLYIQSSSGYIILQSLRSESFCITIDKLLFLMSKLARRMFYMCLEISK